MLCWVPRCEETKFLCAVCMCFIQCCLLQEVLTEHVCAIGVQWGFNVVGGMTVIDSDFSFIDSQPLDIYSRQEFSDEESQDTVYGAEEEFNTLFYDLNNDSDNEASEDLENDRSVSQCQSFTSIQRTDSKISTFVCTQQNT